MLDTNHYLSMRDSFLSGVLFTSTCHNNISLERAAYKVHSEHVLYDIPSYNISFVFKTRLKFRDISTIHKEYKFFLTPIFPCKDRIFVSGLIRENTGQSKHVFWHILRSVLFWKCVKKKLLLTAFLEKATR